MKAYNRKYEWSEVFCNKFSIKDVLVTPVIFTHILHIRASIAFRLYISKYLSGFIETPSKRPVQFGSKNLTQYTHILAVETPTSKTKSHCEAERINKLVAFNSSSG